MSQFSNILHLLEAQAEAAIHDAEKAGMELVQKLVPVIEDGFTKAVQDFGTLACQTVIKFLQEEFAVLTGQEKQGGVVTHLIQQAEIQGKQLALQDAQALAKSAFLAVSGQKLGQ